MFICVRGRPSKGPFKKLRAETVKGILQPLPSQVAGPSRSPVATFLHLAECESIQTTMRTRLLWTGVHLQEHSWINSKGCVGEDEWRRVAAEREQSERDCVAGGHVRVLR